MYSPETYPEQWKGKSFSQAIGTASTEETPLAADLISGIANFMGSYRTAAGLLPSGEGLLTDKPGWQLEGERFFTATSLPEVSKVICQEENAYDAIKNVVSNTAGGMFFGGTAKLEASESAKLALQSSFMYAQARLNGEDVEHAAIQGAMPYAFKATELLKNDIPEKKSKKSVAYKKPESFALKPKGNKPPEDMTPEEFSTYEYPPLKGGENLSQSVKVKKLLEDAGIPIKDLQVRGSRAFGVETPESDYDIYVKVSDKDRDKADDIVSSLSKEGIDVSINEKGVGKKGGTLRGEKTHQRLIQKARGIITTNKKSPTSDTIVSKSAESPIDNPSNVHEATRNTLGGNFVSGVADTWQRFTGYIGGLAGETLPVTTRAHQPTGEAGARYISARIEAPFRARDVTGEILETGADPMQVGAVLTEDNLRSIRKNFEDAGDSESAANVHTLVGDGGRFQTEEDYQTALNDPIIKETLERYKQIFSPIMDELYKKAQEIAPDETLPTRGHQTGVRINLKAVSKDEPAEKGDISKGQSAGGNLLGTFKKKSPFGVKAKGTGQDYDTNLYNIIENTYARQLEIARYHDFIESMKDNGLAIEGKPGEVHDGYTKFPLQRKTIVISKDGKVNSYPKSKTLYVKNEFAGEFRGAVNVDAPIRGKAIKLINRGLNTAAITGLTDATAHTLNLTTAMLTRPGIGGDALREGIAATGGIGDIAVITHNMIKKGIDVARGDPATTKQMAELAEIGALRSAHKGGGIGGRFLRYYDRLARLVMDDGYKFLVKKGMAEDSQTARREFVNQVGQYNRRAQGEIMRTLKDAGVSPFIVAGKTFVTLGVRNVTMSPGVEATSPAKALQMRGLVAARWAGTIGSIMVMNYMLTKNKGGGIGGRPGTPLLSIDTGKDDKQGRPIVIPIGSIFGYSRALRVTGLLGVIEGIKNGLTDKQAIEDGLQDIGNSLAGIIGGPAVRFVVGALTGHPTAVGFPRQFPAVPPGEMQMASDTAYALGYSNPISAALIEGARKNPGDWAAQAWNFVQRQLPGVSPKSGMKPKTIEDLPKIINSAQVNEFVDYTAKEAKKLPIEERMDYLMKELERIPEPELRMQTMTKIFQKGVFYP
jgi:hypothetical protein